MGSKHLFTLPLQMGANLCFKRQLINYLLYWDSENCQCDCKINRMHEVKRFLYALPNKQSISY